jgi:hypothetical protein
MKNQMYEYANKQKLPRQCTDRVIKLVSNSNRQNPASMDRSIYVMSKNQKNIQYNPTKSKYVLNQYDHLVIRNCIYEHEPHRTFSDIPESVIRSVKNLHTDIIEGSAGFKDDVLTFTLPGSFNIIIHESTEQENKCILNKISSDTNPFNKLSWNDANNNDDDCSLIKNSHRINIVVIDSNKNSDRKCIII